MKTLKKLSVLAAILLFSCSTSDEPILEFYDPDSNPSKENPYNAIGLVFQRLINIYQARKDLNVSEINKQLQYTIDDDIIIHMSNLRKISPHQESGISIDETSLFDLIDNSPLSEFAKDSLSDFIQALISYNGAPISIVLQEIDSYESEVLNNSNLTAFDQQVILTFIALVKSTGGDQNMPPMDEPEDPDEDEDWEIIVGNLFGYLSIALSQSTDAMAEEILKTLEGL